MAKVDSSPRPTWIGLIQVRIPLFNFYSKANIPSVKARALYSYEGTNADELPFAEGDELSIVDRADADWWKTEQSGVVFIVPAAYLEVVEGQ